MSVMVTGLILGVAFVVGKALVRRAFQSPKKSNTSSARTDADSLEPVSARREAGTDSAAAGQPTIESDDPLARLPPAVLAHLVGVVQAGKFDEAAQLLAAHAGGTREQWMAKLRDEEGAGAYGVTAWSVTMSDGELIVDFTRGLRSHRFDSNKVNLFKRRRLLHRLRTNDVPAVAQIVAKDLGVEVDLVAALLGDDS